jgi:hypothetical protein
MPRLATATKDSYHYRDQLDRPNQFYIDGVRAVPSDGAGLNNDYLLFGNNNPGMEISAVRDTPFQVEFWFRPDDECFGLLEDRHLVWSWGAISTSAQTDHRAVALVVMRNSGGSTIAQAGRYDGTAGGNWSNGNFNVAITPGGWHYFKAIFTSGTACRYWLYDYTADNWALNNSGTTYNAGTHRGINIGNVVGTWGNEMLFSNGDSKPFVGGISCFRVALTSDDGVNPNTNGIPTYTPANVGTNALIGFMGPS